MPVANPAKWTAETPNLYTAVLSLSGGVAPELLSQRVDFREIEVKSRLFCVNGVPIKLKDANRHENGPETEHYVPEAAMMRDIELERFARPQQALVTALVQIKLRCKRKKSKL